MQGHWKALLIVPILVAILLVGVSAQGFGTKGVSSRELPKGICVIEVDEVIDSYNSETENQRDKTQILDLVITETGRKPAFAKVQSLWLAAEPEDLEDQLFSDRGNVNIRNGMVGWDGLIRIAPRTLTGTPTGVPAKTLVLTPGGTPTPLLIDELLSQDMVPSYNTFIGPLLTSNGFAIPSQGVAGQISLRFAFVPAEDLAYDFHAIVVIESPVGNLCSMNLVPVRDRALQNFNFIIV